MLKLVAGLSVALLLSLAGNVWQVTRQARAEGEDAGKATAAAQLAEAVGKLDAAAESLERSATVADEAATEQAALASEFTAIADRAKERVTVYRDRIREVPAATCAPGPERMDAWNGVLK